MICPNCSTIEEEVEMEKVNKTMEYGDLLVQMIAYWCCGCGYETQFKERMEEW